MIYRYQFRGQIHEINLERHGESYRATVNGKPYIFEILEAQPGELSLRFEGKPTTLYWAGEGGQKWVSMEGCTYLLEKPSPRSASRTGDLSAENAVRAPMPAQVQTIQVLEDDIVEKGQTLMLLEAMKMEIHIKAPRAGHLRRLPVQEGQSVDRDQVLAEIEPIKGDA